MHVKPRVLIVGAGVIGCTLAHELTARGATVTVLDSAAVLSGTSSATFGWINANNKEPAEYARLNLLGIHAHERARDARRLGAADWFQQVGNLQVATNDEEMAALDFKVAKLVSSGYDALLLTRREVQALEPSMASSGLVGGALYPKEGWVDTATMCFTLLHSACAAGAQFESFEQVISVGSSGQVTSKAPDGSLTHHHPDVTVLAAGNGNRRILAASGYDFPTRETGPTTDPSSYPAVGLISTTGPVDSGIRHVIHAPGIAIRPGRNGGVVFTDSATGAKWRPNDPEIWTVPGLLLERARRLYPSLGKTETEAVTLGTRVLPTDGVTIADWVNPAGYVYAVATHSGVTLAPHLAEVVSTELLGGERHESLDTFGLNRFAQ